MKNHQWFLTIGLLTIIGAAGLGGRAQAQEAASSLGAYGETWTYCGNEAIPKDVAAIPWVGCFSLSAGHSARGTLSDQKLEIAVDANGRESFTVNGTVIETIGGPQRPASGTNSPLVRVGGAEYSFCRDETAASCGANIAVFSRNPDKSVLFIVAECLPPANHVCVTTQKNWDFEKARRP